MDSPCIKQTVCKVLKIFQYGKYLVAYVLKAYCLWSGVHRIAEESTSDQTNLLPFCFLHLFPVCVIRSIKVKDNSDNL